MHVKGNPGDKASLNASTLICKNGNLQYLFIATDISNNVSSGLDGTCKVFVKVNIFVLISQGIIKPFWYQAYHQGRDESSGKLPSFLIFHDTASQESNQLE